MSDSDGFGSPNGGSERPQFRHENLVGSVAAFAGEILVDRIVPAAQKLQAWNGSNKAQEAAADAARQKLASKFNGLKERASQAVEKISQHVANAGRSENGKVQLKGCWEEPVSYYEGVTPDDWLPRIDQRLEELLTTIKWVNELTRDCERAEQIAKEDHSRRLARLQDIASKANQACFRASQKLGERNLKRLPGNLVVTDTRRESEAPAEDFDALTATAERLVEDIEQVANAAVNFKAPPASAGSSLGRTAAFFGVGIWIIAGALLRDASAGFAAGLCAAVGSCVLQVMIPRWGLDSVRARLVAQTARLEEILASAASSSRTIRKRDNEVAIGALKGSAKVENERLLERLNKGLVAVDHGLASDFEYLQAKLDNELQSKRRLLDSEMASIHHEFATIAEDCSNQIGWSADGAPDWDHSSWNNWKPVERRSLAVAVGRIDPAVLSQVAIDRSASLPFLAPFGEGKSLAIRFPTAERDAAAGVVVNTVTRLLAVNRAAGVKFTFVDPQYLGRSVEKFHRLAEYEPQLISGRCYTDERGIKQRLDDLINQIEGTTRERLKDRHRDIESYNAGNPEVAEPYHFLVLFDFPEGFDSASCNRLLKVLRNGPRCGVYAVIHWAEGTAMPYQTNAADIENTCGILKVRGNAGFSDDPRYHGWNIRLFGEPNHESARLIVEEIGKNARSNIRVNVPFTSLHAAEFRDPSSLWRTAGQGQSSAAEVIEVPLGPGGNSIQSLRFGLDLEHHALIVGGTGSGKSNLMHVIITGMALRYPPDELEMYLVDFKGGVEFKRYAAWRLPHARAVAIESEREFGLSILRELTKEMRRRGDVFRSIGDDVVDLPAYRLIQPGGEPGRGPMKRIVLLVDEFQDFFLQNDAIAEEARSLFEQLARKGRSAGIHFILGSQSISGGLLSNTTENLTRVRIVLKCSDDEAREVLGPDNPAARLLTRPGEAIYNGQGGSVEGNHRFQVSKMCPAEAVLPHILRQAEIRDRELGLKPNSRSLVIFEGNEAPALPNCGPLLEAFANGAAHVFPAVPQLWIGESIDISPAIAVRLVRHSGSNVLAVTRDEKDGAGVCIAAVVQMVAQMRADDLQVFHFEASSQDEPLPDVLSEAGECFDPDRVHFLRGSDFLDPLASILEHVRERREAGGGSHGRILVVLQGLHRMRQFRRTGSRYDPLEEGSAGEVLQRILEEGPDVGVHVVIWVDGAAALMRCFDSDILSSFSHRLAGRMSLEDSNELLQCSDAFKIDKERRMCAAFDEKPGETIMLRPYAVPTAADLKDLLTPLTH